MAACMGGAGPWYCPDNPCAGCPHRTIYQTPLNTKVAQLCPVCRGGGDLPIEPPNASFSGRRLTITCHGCDGRGWVVVDG
jgi:hypothetical protein